MSRTARTASTRGSETAARFPSVVSLLGCEPCL